MRYWGNVVAVPLMGVFAVSVAGLEPYPNAHETELVLGTAVIAALTYGMSSAAGRRIFMQFMALTVVSVLAVEFWYWRVGGWWPKTPQLVHRWWGLDGESAYDGDVLEVVFFAWAIVTTIWALYHLTKPLRPTRRRRAS